MKLKHLAVVLLLLILCGCGGGGSTGGLTVTATATGSVVNAQATYVNPNVTTNLNGVPITFSAQVGNQNFPLGTVPTNSSGIANAAFSPTAFNGTQTITVIATTGDLSSFSTITMTGSSLTVNAPPTLALTATSANLVGSSFPFTLPSSAGFVTLVDPFVSDLSGHTIDISTTVAPTNYTFTPLATTTVTVSGGTAPFPGGSGTMIVPAVGITNTMTITFTVTDTTTGLTGSGVTTVTLTKSS